MPDEVRRRRKHGNHRALVTEMSVKEQAAWRIEVVIWWCMRGVDCAAPKAILSILAQPSSKAGHHSTHASNNKSRRVLIFGPDLDVIPHSTRGLHAVRESSITRQSTACRLNHDPA